MQRSEALQKAEQLINGARARTHGDAKDTHESIAKIMNVFQTNFLRLLILN